MPAKERTECIIAQEKISAADNACVHAELRSVLTRKEGSGNSVDWASIAHVIVEHHTDRLEYVHFLPSSNATVVFTDAAEQRFAVCAQLLVMLGPYMGVMRASVRRQR